MVALKKIKITLTNGSVIEKKVLTAFKGTYGDYVVLDNESVGSMGLPVILISKIQDNKLNTIVDANEWNAVKDNLRNIIAGNQIVKINVGDEYTGDDVYYKQLTLPVASFDALKNTFGEEEGGEVTPAAPSVEPVAPVAPEAMSTPVAPEMPTNVNPESVAPEQVVSQPTAPMPNVSPVGPMSPEAPTSPSVEAPTVATPEVPNVEPVAPEMPMPPMNEMATVSEPTIPVVEPIPTTPENNNAPIDVAADKEAFLKACENMFDALVAKFNK